MRREKNTFAEYGVRESHDQFVDMLVDAFNSTVRGQITIDELLLHPKEALVFCESVRKRFGYSELPDDAILRPILQRRKNPEG